MNNDSNYRSDSDLHLLCRRIVRDLIKKYNWTLLSENELVKLVLTSIESKTSSNELKRLAKHHYNIALYEACRQVVDRDRCEQGYRELHRYLFRMAYNRWPDLAEPVTQRAVTIIYDKISDCQRPATFSGFAYFKLLQAFKDHIRGRSKDLPLEWLDQISTEEHSMLQTRFEAEECIRILIEAIKHLLDERQQKVIVSRFFEGLSDKEIAIHLKTTSGNVRVIRNRALKQLRRDKQLREHCLDQLDRQGDYKEKM